MIFTWERLVGFVIYSLVSAGLIFSAMFLHCVTSNVSVEIRSPFYTDRSPPQ